jgi:hypothetical protein
LIGQYRDWAVVESGFDPWQIKSAFTFSSVSRSILGPNQTLEELVQGIISKVKSAGTWSWPLISHQVHSI